MLRFFNSVSRPCPPKDAKLLSPANVFDLFSARYSRGSGRDRAVMCPICAEPMERGGESTEVWLNNGGGPMYRCV